MQQVTIRELAAACGVSIGTVSKALRRSERISEETIRRVEEKARELGYVGSQAARSLSMGRRRLAIVLPTASPDYERYTEAYLGMYPMLTAYGLMPTEVAPEEAGDFDAVLVHASLASRLSVGEGVPVGVIGGRAPALYPVTEAFPDFRVGGRLAAQFLAFATGGGATAVLTTRREYGEDEAARGFRELSAKLGITVAAVAECGDSPRAVSAEVRRLLASAPRLRGLFVTAPILGPVVAALGEAKKKITVVGSDFTRPALDALRAGGVAALLYSSPERQMESVLIELCNELAGRKTDDAVFRIRQELVLKSNLENYLCKGDR